jgi:flagellar biosynthesis protein FlhA
MTIQDVSSGKAATVPNSGRDVGFAVGIIGILSILFLPIPAFAIDLGLAFSISLSVLILMVSLWIQKPLEFSSFPTILLVATMLRLSLNIATTRVILSHGNEGSNAAGYIIDGFSRFVIAGDFVIGLIVFIILVTVNFIVITKGATRPRPSSAGASWRRKAPSSARWTAPRNSSVATPSRV